MKKTRRVLKRHWDEKFSRFLRVSFKTLEREIIEHSAFMKWIVRYVLLPVSIFYVILGVFFEVNVLASLFIGFFVFLYSNFLPDFDSLLTPNTEPEKTRKSSVEKFGLLFFGPVFVYYLLSGRAQPIYCQRKKEFHSFKYLLAFCVFLFLVGLLFWGNSVKVLSLPFFGGLGYATHLFVDGYMKFR